MDGMDTVFTRVDRNFFVGAIAIGRQDQSLALTNAPIASPNEWDF